MKSSRPRVFFMKKRFLALCLCCCLAPTFQIVGIFHFLASILKINDARNAQRLRILSAWLFPNIFIRLLVLYYVLQHTLLDSLNFCVILSCEAPLLNLEHLSFCQSKIICLSILLIQVTHA